MAIVWYKSSTHSGTLSWGRSIYVSGRNALITLPKTYNNVLYGTKDNPIYRVHAGAGLYEPTDFDYYISSSVNIGGERKSEFQNTSMVGVIDGDKYTPTIDDYSTNDTDCKNVQISGRWRAKDTWTTPTQYLRYYAIPVVHSVWLKDGTEYSGISSGNGSNDTSATYIDLGGVRYGSATSPYTLPDNLKDMVVDFGAIPQDVPQLYKTFLQTNFTYIYPNTYTIKSPAGETLAQIDEQPPVKHTNLIQAGVSYQLSITGADDVVRTLTWEYDTPTNVVFEGLGTSPNGSVIIPVGEADITIEASTILYPIFRPYRPLPEVFGIDLYKNTAEANRVDKSNYLTFVRTLRGVMRESSSVTNLTITIQYPNYPDFNYVRIPELKRYYFVNDITIINANLYELDLSVDPLMSYKNAILGLTAFLDRNEFLSNPMIIDKKRVIEQGVDIETHQIYNDLFINPSATNSPLDINIVLNGYKIDSTDEIPK